MTAENNHIVRLPLLAAQQGVCVAQKLDETNPRFNCGGYLEVHGAIDAALLECALRQATAESEALRISLVEDEDGQKQVIKPLIDWQLQVIDLSNHAFGKENAELWMKTDLLKALDLSKEPLFCHVLFKISDEHFLYYLRYHHIVMDGIGQMLYWRRVADIYSAQLSGEELRPSPFGPLRNLLHEDAAYRASPEFTADRNFWLKEFADRPDSIHLAGRSAVAGRGLLRRSITLPTAITEGVKLAARRTGSRWSVILVAAAVAYIGRLTGRHDVIVTLPVAGRLSATARTTPAMLANELPLRVAVPSTATLQNLVDDVSAQIGRLLAHQRYRGEELHSELRSRGSEERPSGPVVNVISIDHHLSFGKHQTTAHHLSSGPVNELLLGFYGKSDGSALELYFDANPDLYTGEDIEGHQRRFVAFLQELTAQAADTRISGINLLFPEEAETLEGFNATERPYDLSSCLHELIDEQARATPDAVAVAVEGRSLTYRELIDRAERLATYLRGQGVGDGHRIGVCEQRSLEMVVDLLAVLKAGGAYVPLDPELPRSRLEFQLRDAGIVLVLSRSSLRPVLEGLEATVVPVDTILPNLPLPSLPVASSATPDSPAYVIYTSGSTGQPKGVEIHHRGVVNRLLWMQEEYALGADDCVLQKTPFTFDVSVWEFFWPLLTGARLFLAEPGEHRDPRAIARIIRDQKVTTVHFVPPMLDLFLAEREAAAATGLRRIICSGEALSPATVKAFFEIFPERLGIGLHNLYGPTEASIDVTFWKCRPQDASDGVPIGRPVANTRIYVLDQTGRPTPIGVPGELYIGGVQVALGYINRQELTQERFLPDPFGGGTMYRTGDLAAFRHDGAVEYLGRLDHQVKLRGFRIELGEIETALRAHSAVGQALVTVWDGGGKDRRLIAYVTTREDGLPVPAALTTWLADRLPEYMIPANIMVLESFPLLPNGKFDRRALPAPEIDVAAVFTPPATDQERLLHAIWSEVLGIGAFGIDDSFFALGGDSMLSIRVRAALERHGLTFEIQDLFRFPTIRALSPRLQSLSADGRKYERTKPFDLLPPEDRARLPSGLEDAYPLSAMQGGMLFQAEFDSDSAVYRVVTSLHLALRLDEAALKRAIAETFHRHPALRCSYDLIHYSEPLQLVHREVEVPVHILEDLGAHDVAARKRIIRDWVDAAKFHRFEPACPPLVSFAIHPRGSEGFQLSVIEHHVVLDGWSDAAMLGEIVKRYRALLAGEELWLPEVPSTYRDFVAEERRVLADQDSRRFWVSMLEGAEPAPLPRRALRGGKSLTTHRAFDVPLATELVEGLREVARREKLSLKALLTAAHVAVLRLVSGTDEVLTGVVANGRLEQQGGDEVIGVFLNTLPLRLDTREASLVDIARLAFAHERDTLPHRRYSFVQMQRDLNGQLQLDSYINFMDFHLEWHSDEAAVRDVIGVADTNFALAVNFLMDPVEGRLRLWLDCDVSVLDAEFCERLAGYYHRALEAAVGSVEVVVAELPLLDPKELARIAAWNRTGVAYDKSATIHDLIELQVARSPDAVALVHRWSEITYADLDERANRLAHHLRDRGVKRGSLVGVSLERGVDLVIALLAVLKAGAAYVPLDPGFPKQRLEFIASDAGTHSLITDRAGPAGLLAASLVLMDVDAENIATYPATRPAAEADGEDPAYVIYTSGSTGRPKGTVVHHRNVVNFFLGMDDRIGCDARDVVLAVTSVSFDISVLELLWPLARGAKIVVASEKLINNLVPNGDISGSALGFSLFFFGAGTGDDQRAEGYRLVLDAARYADTHGFEAIWTPERHFHQFGGLYPNPSVLSAALATITERVQLRCGSVVAPIHDSIRIAEEWSLVDNLSQGRVGLAFASGWNANDFIFRPENYARRWECADEQLQDFLRLWRGELVRRRNGNGDEVEVRIFPSPVQERPAIWYTSSGAVDTFKRAGSAGVNILTHLLGQDLGELAAKIDAYRRAWVEHGHCGDGKVTVMIHTFLLEDPEEAKSLAREPFRDYLRTSTGLLDMLTASMGVALPETMSEDDLDSILDMAVERYFERSGLFGAPETTIDIANKLAAAGVNEVACLVDFGIPNDKVMKSLVALSRLKELHERDVAEAAHSLADLCRRHGVTLLQGTPSFLSAVVAEPAALASLRSARAILAGGEAFPAGLADRLIASLPGVRLFNMYGPTETTIWSTVHELDVERDVRSGVIPIGRPIANTEVLVLDGARKPVPIGVDGELWIGGEGVAGTYLNRPDLTAERFPLHPHDTTRGQVYRTGDRVRWRPDGLLEFLGRVDRQVKILGHRIEPDEVESVLSRHPQVTAVAVIPLARENGTLELVAYVSPSTQLANVAAEDAHVRRWGEVWEDAYCDADTGVDIHDPDRQFAGWLSSYTGDPIPASEMREWLAHTIKRIIRLNARAVVDVGTGVGLVLRGLAPSIERYLGYDVSQAALRSAEASLRYERDNLPHLELIHGDAGGLASLGNDAWDLVVFNSVIQYFPNTAYLERVLAEAVRVTGENGAVFVGDVRDLNLLEAFHVSVQLSRAPPLTPAWEIAAAVARQVAAERELCLSSLYVRDLAARLAPKGEVRLEIKGGHAANELSCFRFDVTLLGRASTAGSGNTEVRIWNALADSSLAGLERLLADTPADIGLTIAGIRNQRLVRPMALVRLLAEGPGDTTAWELERSLWEADDGTALAPQDIEDLADRLGRRVWLLIPAHGRLDEFDAVFKPKDCA